MTTSTGYVPELNQRPEVLIDWFDDFNGPHPYTFLSNFHTGHPIMWSGLEFPTTEHAFAWAKVDRDAPGAHAFMEEIRTADSPGAAKARGRVVPLDPEWESVKYDIMQRVVWAKFSQHPDLAERLLATDTAYLQEGTFWGDRIWGVDLYSHHHPMKRVGLNWLGKILMGVRTRIEWAGL